MLQMLSTSSVSNSLPLCMNRRGSLSNCNFTDTDWPSSGWSSAFCNNSYTNRSSALEYRSSIILCRALTVFFASRSVKPVSLNILRIWDSRDNLSLRFVDGRPNFVSANVIIKGFLSLNFLGDNLTLIRQISCFSSLSLHAVQSFTLPIPNG